MPQKILLVEDDQDQRMLFTEALTMTGYQVVAVPDGETALRLLSSEAYDLLLSDWYLTGMTGDTLIRQVKQRQSSMKTVLMSNHVDVLSAAQSCVADRGLRKGDLSQLISTVTALLPSAVH